MVIIFLNQRTKKPINMYDQLLQSRKNYRNGKARGHEWKPVKMAAEPLVSNDNGIPETVERCIAIALMLELPAGEWAACASRLELKPYAKELLLSNAADETVHLRAFEFAAEDYLHDNTLLNEAHDIAELWENNASHPIEKVALAETGVFLPSLAFLRLFGGATLNHIAANVSRDEQRHVQCNRAILDDLDIKHYEPRSTLERNRRITLDWMFAPMTQGGFTTDFWLEESTNLISTGRSKALEELTLGSDDYSPFELPNNTLY